MWRNKCCLIKKSSELLSYSNETLLASMTFCLGCVELFFRISINKASRGSKIGHTIHDILAMQSKSVISRMANLFDKNFYMNHSVVLENLLRQVILAKKLHVQWKLSLSAFIFKALERLRQGDTHLLFYMFYELVSSFRPPGT